VRIVVPVADAERIDRLREKFQALAAQCEIEACVRMLARPACEVY
jgi:hypothetical protein